MFITFYKFYATAKMFELGKILMYKAVIHTFNKDSEYPVCSTFEIDHDEELTFEMLKNNIEKLYSSNDMKWASFKENSPVEKMMESLDADLNLFMEVTKDISYVIQKVIHENREALPSCDIAFVLFEMENVMYFGCIKLNHKDLFIRKLEETRDGAIAMLGRSNDLYLSPKSKIEEGFIIHLKFMDIALLDKTYNVKGEKTSFFESLILDLDTNMSEREKLKSFNQINKRIQEKFIGEDISQKAQIKKAISDTIVEDGSLDVKKVLDKVFDDTQEIKSIYKEAFKKANLDKQEIKVGETVARKFDKQKIVTEDGIEVNIPVDYYGQDDKVEIIANADGTISITIKNIAEYKIL